MKLLIVDDEASAIEAVRRGLNWAALPFDQVETAGSKQEAIEVMTRQPVDVLLCDIEMPRGSGLELLEWVNANAPGVRCVFMTCHADFGYAQRAIQLGSADYILKPLDFEKLTRVLQKIASQLDFERSLQLASTSWSDNQEVLVRQFWKDFFTGDIAPSLESIRRYLERTPLPIELQCRYQPVLISTTRWPEGIKSGDYKLIQYAMRNMAAELFDLPGYGRTVVAFTDETVLVVLTSESEAASEQARVKQSCRSLIEAAERHLKAAVSCYVGTLDDICSMLRQLELLQTMDFNNVWQESGVVMIGQHVKAYVEYTSNEFARWRDLLRNDQYDRVSEEIEAMLLKNPQANRAFLEWFERGFYFVIYDFTYEHKMFLKQMFDDEHSRTLSRQAQNSLQEMLRWTQHALRRMRQLSQESEGLDNPVEKIKRYLEKHLSEELSVEQLARQVHLNADYLTRIFKKETGLSLSRYMIDQKIQRAQLLLRETDLAIGDIAAKVGYYNYSSFNRAFSKETGMSPQEYKNKRG